MKPVAQSAGSKGEDLGIYHNSDGPSRLKRGWTCLAESFQRLELFRAKFPGFGTFSAKTSKVWNFSVEKCPRPRHLAGRASPRYSSGRVWNFLHENFQGLELLAVRTSKDWNFLPRNFQRLELFTEKLPRFGTFCIETSKAWNFFLVSLKLPSRRFPGPPEGTEMWNLWRCRLTEVYAAEAESGTCCSQILQAVARDAAIGLPAGGFPAGS